MRVLLDHNVPISVADVFREFGHFVQLVSEILPTNSPDPLVAAVKLDCAPYSERNSSAFSQTEPHFTRLRRTSGHAARTRGHDPNSN